MKKDVIYIDIEDDITSIINKIKSASAGIVALVPPKRVGALQSAVNLKLLTRAASSANKRIVLITNDAALIPLAAGLQIPVAKNLQSRPEVPTVTALDVDDGDDVINGEELPVGDLAKTSPVSAAIANETVTPINDAAKSAGDGIAASSSKAAAKKSPTPKKGGFAGKIPHFDTFRKKLFLLGGLGVFLIAFLVWAIVFAPQATVTIAAKTDAINIGPSLTLDPNVATDPSLARIKPEIKQIKKNTSTEFDTTGTKEIGEKSKGTMQLTRTSVSSMPIEVPAGTSFTANGLTFVSTEATSLSGTTIGPGGIVQDSATVRVEADAIGEQHNVAAASYNPSVGGMTAQGSAMAGGTKQTVQVVSPEDIEEARSQLKAQDEAAVKDELSKQFTGDVIIIQESFTTAQGQPTASPAVGEQARRAKLSVETTYTLIALPRADVDDLLDDILTKQLNEDTSKRIYSNGDSSLKFSQFLPIEGGLYKVTLTTTGYIGPVINESELANQLVGKRFGEIEQIVNNIDGVQEVTVDFSPFWVNSAPKSEKIDIKFTVQNNAN